MPTREDARNAQKSKEKITRQEEAPESERIKAKRVISAGVIVYRRTREGTKFLILYHGHGYWNFPKGKIESEEQSLEAALRETREETGIPAPDLRIIRNFRAHERFFYKWAGEPFFKIVIFYLAETRNPRVRVSDEHEGYGWFTAQEGMKIMAKYRDSQRVLKQAHEFLRGRSRARPASSHVPPRRLEPPRDRK